jgi:hypothetical protein
MGGAVARVGMHAKFSDRLEREAQPRSDPAFPIVVISASAVSKSTSTPTRELNDPQNRGSIYPYHAQSTPVATPRCLKIGKSELELWPHLGTRSDGSCDTQPRNCGNSSPSGNRAVPSPRGSVLD